jgi:hypothetical protein
MAETPASPTPALSSEEPAPAPDAPAAAPAPEAPVAPPASDAPVAATPPAALDAAPSAVEALDAVEFGEPRVATTLEVPPLPAGANSAFTKSASPSGQGFSGAGTPGAGTPGAGPGPEGGEWDLLVGKVKTWLEDNDLPGQWERLGGPLRGLGVLLGVLLVLKLYVALLDTLDDLPLLPRLLQLVGLIVVLRFSLLRLTRSGDRQAVLDDWKRRWEAFRGA